MEAVVDLKYQPVFPNGGMPAAAAKKTRLGAPAAAVAAVGGEAGVYRECLKNHAATLGGHALDGCGESMPSPEADPADPSSLRCAACGCHRNFHRRLLEPPPPPPPPLLALPPPPLAPAAVPAPPPAVASHSMRDGRTMMRGEEAPADDRLPVAFDEETEESDDGSGFDEDRPLSPLPAPAMPPHGHGYRHQAAAPHMLLALRTGAPSPGVQTPAAAPRPPPPPPASSLGAMPSSAPGTVPPGASAARKQVQPGTEAADAGAVGAAGVASPEARRGGGGRVLPGDGRHQGRLQGVDAQQQAQLRRRPQRAPQLLFSLCRRSHGHPPSVRRRRRHCRLPFLLPRRRPSTIRRRPPFRPRRRPSTGRACPR